MYLKKIEMYGFKSFADKIELEFEDGITAVVGPNGSGKSNIADAVQWVLGEQSAKSLRGSKMEDIIFAGTQKRKPLGYAEVSLVIENDLGKLPIDYQEVRITRRVFRSGESEFYINKSSCRLKDIHQLFMDTGLGREGYSIIGQGKIDDILSASSQDRRYIFEEAAGIVKYKTRKNEAEKKLDRTEQNLIRIVDIIQELETQIDPLSAQAEKAKQFLIIKNKLKEHELALFIFKIDSLKEKLKDIEKNKENVLSQIEVKEKEIQDKEKYNNKFKNNLKKSEDTFNASQKNIYDIRSDIEKNQSDIKLFKTRIENIIENQNRLAIEIDETQETILRFTKEKIYVESESHKLSLHIAKQSNILSQEKEHLIDLKKAVREKEINNDGKRKEEYKLINTLSDLKSNLNGIHIMENNIQNQLHQMNIQCIDFKEKTDYQITQIEEEKEKKRKKEEEINRIDNCKNSSNCRIKDFMTQITRLQDANQKSNKELQLKQSKIKVLIDMENEYDGYFKSVKNLMVERKKDAYLEENVYGVIAELIHVPNEYIVAMERALAASLQNIVVKSEYVAQECIEILNKNKWGRATFLPLEIMKGRKIAQELNVLKESKGFIGIASDLIQYDTAFTPIIEQLLGRVIIVNKMEDGIFLSRKLNHRFKIVTLNGDVFNPGGSIMGGSNSQNNNGLLSRQQEIEKLSEDINVLKVENDTLRKQLKNILNKKEETEHEVKRLNENLKTKEIELINMENTCKQLLTEKNRIYNELIKVQDEMKKLHSECEDLKDKKIKLNETLIKTDKEIERINHEINTTNIINSDKTDQLEGQNNKIIQLEIEIAKDKQKKVDFETQLEQLYKNIQINTNSMIQKKENKKSYDSQITEYGCTIKEKKEHINSIQNKKIEKEEQIEKLLQSKKELEERIQIYEDDLRECNKQFVISNNALHKTEIQLSKAEFEIENLQNKIFEEYQLTYNLALGYKKEIDNMQKLNSEIRGYKEQLQKIGNVNINSIEEYERLSERFNFLSKQREDLDIAKKSLHEVIKEIAITMEKQFQVQFELIKEEFNVVFGKLFQGGYAKVYLVEPQNALKSGVEIEVQPPGKKSQNLSLLSGGERALTAIALLFAILNVKPTPFCILDEIEAALDDSNVYRFANFLKEISIDTQFIAVTHRKGTMEAADVLYGVTMEEQGVSKLVSVKLKELVS